MGVKISELPEATSVQEEDIMPIVQNGETKKVSMSKVGGNEVFIGDIEDAPEDAKIVIDDDGVDLISSEVVNSLSGDETAKAPSVKAVKDALSYSTTEQVVGTWIDGKPLYRIVFTGTCTATQTVIMRNASTIDLIFSYGYVLATDNHKIPINSSFGTNGDNDCRVVQYGTGQNTIAMQNASLFVGNSYYIVLEYTKTTD